MAVAEEGHGGTVGAGAVRGERASVGVSVSASAGYELGRGETRPEGSGRAKFHLGLWRQPGYEFSSPAKKLFRSVGRGDENEKDVPSNSKKRREA